MNSQDKSLSICRLNHIAGDNKFDKKILLIVHNSKNGEIVTKIFDDEKTARDILYFIGNALLL